MLDMTTDDPLMELEKRYLQLLKVAIEAHKTERMAKTECVMLLQMIRDGHGREAMLSIWEYAGRFLIDPAELE